MIEVSTQNMDPQVVATLGIEAYLTLDELIAQLFLMLRLASVAGENPLEPFEIELEGSLQQVFNASGRNFSALAEQLKNLLLHEHPYKLVQSVIMKGCEQGVIESTALFHFYTKEQLEPFKYIAILLNGAEATAVVYGSIDKGNYSSLVRVQL